MRSERWSDPAEIRNILSPGGAKGPSGPLLYHNNGRSWHFTEEGHTIFLGSSGTGKSRRGTIPMIRGFIESGESFAVADPKGEIHRLTAPHLRKSYRKCVLDFRHIFESQRFNILALPTELYHSTAPEDRQAAMERIDEIAHALYPVAEKDPFWAESARSLFIAAVYTLMEYAKPDQVTMANVYHLIARGDERFGGPNNTYLKEFVNMLPGDSIAAMLMQSYVTTAEETRAGVRSTFLEGLSMFARSEGLISMMSHDDLHINKMDGETPLAIYIILPDESPIYDAVAGVILNQLLNHFIRLAEDRYNGRLPRRLNVCLEELASIGRSISALPHLMAAGRSRNIRCQLVLQSLSQLDTLYGTSQATTIRDNADVIVAFRTSHWGTLVELSNKCGERELECSGHRIREHLITPAQLGAMQTGQALVMISGRTKFISWIPDYTELFDCSGWKAPERSRSVPRSAPPSFDIREYVKEAKRKKMDALLNAAGTSRNPASVFGG